MFSLSPNLTLLRIMRVIEGCNSGESLLADGFGCSKCGAATTAMRASRGFNCCYQLRYGDATGMKGM